MCVCIYVLESPNKNISDVSFNVECEYYTCVFVCDIYIYREREREKDFEYNKVQLTMMDDRDEWWERVREIHISRMT